MNIRWLRNEETPFMSLRIGADSVELYWIKRCADYQVVWISYKEGTLSAYGSTSGGNYNKTDASLDDGFLALGKGPKGWYEGGPVHKYHVGGYFYKVPVKEIRCYG